MNEVTKVFHITRSFNSASFQPRLFLLRQLGNSATTLVTVSYLRAILVVGKLAISRRILILPGWPVFVFRVFPVVLQPAETRHDNYR